MRRPERCSKSLAYPSMILFSPGGAPESSGSRRSWVGAICKPLCAGTRRVRRSGRHARASHSLSAGMPRAPGTGQKPTFSRARSRRQKLAKRGRNCNLGRGISISVRPEHFRLVLVRQDQTVIADKEILELVSLDLQFLRSRRRINHERSHNRYTRVSDCKLSRLHLVSSRIP